MAKALKSTLADKIKVKRIVKKKKVKLGNGEKQQLIKKTRSGLESKALGLLEKHQIDYAYEPKESKLKYIIPESTHTYLPDVVIDGIIYELKGLWEATDRKKMLCVRDCNPNQKIVMVFQRNNPINKGSKTRYSDWCDKHGLEWMMISEFEQEIVKRHKNKIKV